MGVEIIRIKAVLSSTGLELELSLAIKLSMRILKQYLSQIKQTNVDDSQQHSRG